VQTIFHLFPEPKLIGFTKLVDAPKFNLTDWFNGKFQTRFEAWLDNYLGFRGYFVKTDNELNYLLFKENHQKTEQKLIIGRDNYLYEKNYIDSSIGRDYRPLNELNERVKSLKILQDKLEKHSIGFILLISPSKASFYPEYIPPALIEKTIEPNPKTNYERVLPLIKENKINYIDARELFLNQKGVSQYPLFPRSGTHWTRYGSCLIMQRLLIEDGRQLNDKYNIPDCSNIKLNSVPQGEDRDLADLSNLWYSKMFYQELAYPIFAKASASLNDIDMLMIGDSFGWGILRNLRGSWAVKNFNFYYYFNSDYDYNNVSNPINKDDSNHLKQEILKRNLVVIEANEAALNDIGFGFIDSAITALKDE